MTSMCKNKFTIILATLFATSIFLFATHSAYAVCSNINNPNSAIINFNFCDYDRADLPVITVNDNTANTDHTKADTVPVTVHSTANLDFSGFSSSTEIVDLKETGVNTGVFTGKLLFVTANTGFPANGEITITQKDPPANTNPSLAETVTEFISSSHPGSNPIQITMTETGTNTGIFQGVLHLGTFSSSAQNTIWAVQGDIVSISDPSQFYTTNSIVTPNTDSSLGVLAVNNNDNPATSMDDTITATYNGLSAVATEGPGRNAPGGGGGGIVSPGLVLDVAASLSSGGSSPPPPTFSLGAFAQANLLPPDLEKKLLNFDPFDPIGPSNYGSVPYYPLSIDGNGYLIGGYANTLQTVTEQVGKPSNVTFTTISRPIVHMSIYTNMHNISDEITDSDTFISYDKGQQLQIVDPHGFFSKVTVDTKQDGSKQSISYNIVFAKSMPKSNIIMRAWDDHHASQDIKLFDAWQAVESGGTQTSDSNVPQAGLVQIAPQPSQAQSTAQTNLELVDIVKQWGGYSPKSISDSELLSDMGIDAKHIPSWYMKTSKWVVNNDVSPEEFVNAIKYMYDKGIIH